ncbi:unnamed protein product, partial [Symbiodinium sp. KB8]
MGRGGKYKQWGKDNQHGAAAQQLWRGSWSPRLRADPLARPWRESNNKEAAHASSFPAYDSMPSAARDPRPNHLDVVTQQGRSHGLQGLLNAARKAELRLQKLLRAKERAAEQWETFQRGLKDSFIKEQTRYNKNGAKLDRDIAEATAEQDKAYEDIQQSVLRGGEVPDAPMAAAEAEASWDRMRSGWENEDADAMSHVLRRAVEAPRTAASVAMRQLNPAVQELLVSLGAIPAWAASAQAGGDLRAPIAPQVPVAPEASHADGPVLPSTSTAPSETRSGAPHQGKADMQISPAHPGQRDMTAARVPTTVEAPRPGIKAATMAPTTAGAPHSLLADKLDAKRAHAKSQAMQPFRGGGAPPPGNADGSAVPVEDPSDQEMDGADAKDGPQSPGLGYTDSVAAFACPVAAWGSTFGEPALLWFFIPASLPWPGLLGLHITVCCALEMIVAFLLGFASLPERCGVTGPLPFVVPVLLTIPSVNCVSVPAVALTPTRLPHEVPVEELVDVVGETLPKPRPDFSLGASDSDRRWVVDAHDLLPEGPDIAPGYWLGVVVITPHFRDVCVAVRCRQFHTYQHVVDVVLDSVHGGPPDVGMTCVPTRPQLCESYATFVRFPSSVHQHPQGRRVVVLVDLTLVGGNRFACALPQRFTMSELLGFVTPLSSASDSTLRLYVAEETSPCMRESLLLQDGYVLTFFDQWLPLPRCVLSVAELMSTPSRLGPPSQLPPAVACEGVLVHHGSDRFYMPAHHHTGQTAIEAVRTAYDYADAESVSCVFPTTDLDFRGNAVSHILFVVEVPSTPANASAAERRRDHFALCDFRPVGYSPRVVHTSVPLLHLPSLAAAFGIRVPVGMRLHTFDGKSEEDEVRFEGNPVLSFVFEECPEVRSVTTSSGLFVDLDDDFVPWPGEHDGRLPRSSHQRGNASGNALPRHRSRSRSRGLYRGFTSLSPPRALADKGLRLDQKGVNAVYPAWASDETYKWSPGILHDALLESTWALTSVPALSVNVGTKICSASEFSAALSFATWSLKLLSEPESHSLSARDRIEDVRDFEEGEGRIWPYLPAQDQFAAQRLAERTAMDEETLGSEDASEFTFCLLTPGYTLEPVVVNLVAPVGIPDALQAVQEERDPVHGRLYPALVVVDPQPAQGYGVLLALPAWPSPEVFICFSLLDIDDRLFVTSAPLVASRERLLELAELEPAELYDVYVGGSPTPMVEAEEVDLVRGMCIFCYPRHVLAGPYFHLTESLLSSAAWERDPSLPYGPADGFMCFVGEFAQRRVPLVDDASFPDNFEIAAALGLHPERLVVQPAYPVTQDAALNGFYCYNVCAALDLLEHDAEEGPPCIILIDCRALLQGWQLVSCPASVLSRTQLIEDLSTFAPPGWSVHLEGIPASSGIYEVPPGKVIYASYVPDSHPWQGNMAAEVTGEEIEGDGSSSGSESSCSQASSHAPGIAGRSRSRSPYRGPGEGNVSPDTRAEGVPFLLLGQEYAPELVIVSRDSPELSAVLQSVQSGRAATCRRRFAQIVPVHPQPAESYALAVVKPAWSREVYVVFDCLRVNGSVFCWLASAAMTRSAILAVAGLPETSDHEVYVPDQDLPLDTQEVCSLSTGACVSIVPRSCPWFVVASLQDMLLDSTCWSTAAALPCVPGDWLYVLSDTGPCCLQIPEARPDELFYAVADALGVPISQATFQLAIPPVDDYSDEGRIAWNTAVLTSTLAAPSGRDGCVYFLDLRALMCGLTWAFTPDGVVSVALVHAQCARPAAGGHLVEVLGGRPVDPASPDEVHVWPGEVLVVQVIDVGVVSPPASTLPTGSPGPGDMHDDHPDGTQGASTPSGRPPARERPIGPSAYTGEVPPYERHMASFTSLLSQVGFGQACVVRCVVGLLITSVLTVSGEAFLCKEAVLLLCFLRCRWHRQTLAIAVMCVSCMPLVASMQSRPVGSVSWYTGVNSGPPPPCGTLPLRAVATPCRARIRSPPSDRFAHLCHWDRGAFGRPLQTLLEESVQDDPESAFFNAATLLETLFEHFSSGVGSSLTGCPDCPASKATSTPHFFLDDKSEEPPCELVLSSLLDFGNDAAISAPGSQTEWFSLDCGSCLMPISDLHWQDLHRCVSVDHLLSSISGLQRPQRFAKWAILHEPQAFPNDAAEICITSDGSFSERPGVAGWGVVLSAMSSASPDVPGLYVGYIAGASNDVWAFGHQSQPINAFGSEIVGLFWAAVAAFQLPFSGHAGDPSNELAVPPFCGFLISAGAGLAPDKAEGVFVAGLQETRTPEGQLASQNYHRYCAGCLNKKVYGIEIWVGFLLPANIWGFLPDMGPTEEEDEAGEAFHGLLHSCGAWVPSTFHDSFSGDGGIDGEALLLPQNSAAVEAVLSSLPVVSWDTNVNDHISTLTDALYRGLAHKFPRQRRRMRQGFLSEETSRVHAELARNRHALRWRMAELRRCFLRCAFVAWQDAKGFFGVFQGLWIRHLRFAIAKLMSLVGVQGKQIRRLCRRDRAVHLNQLAAEVDDADASSVHIALRRLLPFVKRLQKLTLSGDAIFLSLKEGRLHSVSAAIVFTDLVAAYYSVVREAVTGLAPDASVQDVAASLRLTDGDLQELEAYAREQPVLAGPDSPDFLRALTAELHSDTWFHLNGDPNLVRTARGTRPGGCIADTVFSLLFQKVLARRAPAADDQIPRVQWSGTRELRLFQESQAPRSCTAQVEDITYADDHASCVVAPSALQLEQAVRNTAGRTLDSVAGHGLAANLGPRKTAALLLHRGAGSRAARARTFGQLKGKLLVLRENSKPVALDAVPQYRHLGTLLTHTGSLLPEVRSRLALARVTLGEGRRKVFCCAQVMLARRVMLFQVHVMSAFLAGSGAWPQLGQEAWHTFEQGITAMYRQLLRIRPCDNQRWSRDAIFNACNAPTPEDSLAAERLRFLGQLARGGPDEAWALLQHSPDMIAGFNGALQWLSDAVCATCELPAFDARSSAWLDFARDRAKRWKGPARCRDVVQATYLPPRPISAGSLCVSSDIGNSA